MTEVFSNKVYRDWIAEIKDRVQSSQVKAAVAVNQELLELYWFLGEQILEKQSTAKWGEGFLKQMSEDLLSEFPDLKGFSHRNLKSIRQWYTFWTRPTEIGKQAVSQIGKKGKQLVSQSKTDIKTLITQVPWGHNILLVRKFDDANDALFYVQKTIEKRLVSGGSESSYRVAVAPSGR